MLMRSQCKLFAHCVIGLHALSLTESLSSVITNNNSLTITKKSLSSSPMLCVSQKRYISSVDQTAHNSYNSNSSGNSYNEKEEEQRKSETVEEEIFTGAETIENINAFELAAKGAHRQLREAEWEAELRSQHRFKREQEEQELQEQHEQHEQQQQQQREEQEQQIGINRLQEEESKPEGKQGASMETTKQNVDIVQAARMRRRTRRKRSADAILAAVMHDALKMRDRGEKPTSEFVYQRAQERLYEEEHGHKMPSAKDNNTKYIPNPPRLHLNRLIRLYPLSMTYDSDSESVEREERVFEEAIHNADKTCKCERGKNAEAMNKSVHSSMTDTENTQCETSYRHSKNYINTYNLFDEDPWPQRSITPSNPVWNRFMIDRDKEETNGVRLREWECDMFEPRPGCNLQDEFYDAMEELAYWELKLLDFLIGVPTHQRRTLPFIYEWQRLLVHRVVRAERRYIAVRNAFTEHIKTNHTTYARSEKLVERIRAIYGEAHRCLMNANYDPFRTKKSILASFMKMSCDEFDQWKAVQRHERDELFAVLT